jgi:hypothetical protein
MTTGESRDSFHEVVVVPRPWKSLNICPLDVGRFFEIRDIIEAGHNYQGVVVVQRSV